MLSNFISSHSIEFCYAPPKENLHQNNKNKEMWSIQLVSQWPLMKLLNSYSLTSSVSSFSSHSLHLNNHASLGFIKLKSCLFFFFFFFYFHSSFFVFFKQKKVAQFSSGELHRKSFINAFVCALNKQRILIMYPFYLSPYIYLLGALLI